MGNIIKKVIFGNSHPSDYEVGVYTFLSVFRFFSFALATALIFNLPFHPNFNWPAIFIAGLLGLYTILKILFRFEVSSRKFFNYTVLVIDLAICIAAVTLTGGAYSPFLLYSLLPITTAALFFPRKVTLVVAVLTSLPIVITRIFSAQVTSNFSFVLYGNYINVTLIFVAFCFILATVSYHSNFNVYQRIQFEAVKEERRRTRQEIHDGIAQMMGYLKTRINLIKTFPLNTPDKLHAELDDVDTILSKCLTDIRDVIDFLEPEMAFISCKDLISSHVKAFQSRMNSSIEFIVSEQLPNMSPSVTLQLSHICQEALTNVWKYAVAKQVWVHLQNTPLGLELVVKDNGVGFSSSEHNPEQQGIGLRIMRERANKIHGIMSVTSSSGQGTEVRVNVPKEVLGI